MNSSRGIHKLGKRARRKATEYAHHLLCIVIVMYESSKQPLTDFFCYFSAKSQHS